MAFRFVKYSDDKYQRLGLLKILVALLDPERRSVASEAINRRIAQLLALDKGEGKATLLIQSAGISSWNFGFTAATSGQVLEWGKIMGLVGSGNQITERGLLLRSLMGEEAIASIRNSTLSPNPFALSPEEKIYFLFLHFELDDPLFFLLKRLSQLTTEAPISGIDADKITCLALYDTLKVYSEIRSSSNLLQAKRLRDLIGRMVTELRIEGEVPVRSATLPKPHSALRAKPDQRDKKRTKTADHEAIPRFEMLADLGLLEKKVQGTSGEDADKTRRSWKYWVTSLLPEFVSPLPDQFDSKFYWHVFSRAACGLRKQPFHSLNDDPFAIALRAYEAYKEVKRPFGHTPLESVALIAMVRSSVRSEIIEMDAIHNLFLDIKRTGILSNTVRFAAGNDLDRMFVDIKSDFVEGMKELRKQGPEVSEDEGGF
jgi:hypothetical protein